MHRRDLSKAVCSLNVCGPDVQRFYLTVYGTPKRQARNRLMTGGFCYFYLFASLVSICFHHGEGRKRRSIRSTKVRLPPAEMRETGDRTVL